MVVSTSPTRAVLAVALLWAGLACDREARAPKESHGPPAEYPDFIAPGEPYAKLCQQEPRGCIARLEYGCGPKSTCRKDVPCDASLCAEAEPKQAP